MAAMVQEHPRLNNCLSWTGRSSEDSVRYNISRVVFAVPYWLFCSNGPYMDYVAGILTKFPRWREERLPPPRVNQSEVNEYLLLLQMMLKSLRPFPRAVRQSGTYTYVILSLTLSSISQLVPVLQWIWISSHGPTASLMLPYAVAMMWVV